MEHTLGLAALGGLLALDTAVLGQFMLGQPLILGTVFGWLLGDLQNGLLIGAMVQLLWIGQLPVGAYVPPEHAVSGGVTVCLTLWLMQRHGLPLGPTMVFALGLAIPAGVLSGEVDSLLRHGNSEVAKRAEAAVERWGLGAVTVLQFASLVPAFLRNALIYAIWLGPLGWIAEKVILSMPLPVLKGLGIVFWALPALAFAVVLDLIAKDRIWGWLAAGLLGTAGLMLLWPHQGLLALILAVTAGTSYFLWYRVTA